MKKLLKIIMVIMLAIAAQGTGFAIDIDDIEDLTTTVTPSVLATSLVGAGNVTGTPSFTGAPVAAGTFRNGLVDGIGLDQGVILSTGDISFALGPNRDGRVGMNNFRPGDSSLNGFVAGGTTDASALEFDFIPPQNRVTFTFVFASDEYPEFVNSQFNDVFALFVNNVNIARVPGTTNPITINTLNGTATPSLFNDNSDLFLPRFMTQYDGFSTVLSVSAIVTPGIANRVKVVIADTADPAMDSAVFLGPAVFSTGTFSISGTITSEGLPLSGVSVALSGAATANTTTNASGVYTFTGLANGSYTVTPSHAGFTFVPVNKAVVLNNADITGQDFTAQPIIVPGTDVLAASFPGSGIWVYNPGSATWAQISLVVPENMLYSGSTLYVDFGGSGIWVLNGSVWSNPTGANPESMVVSGSTLYADFGVSGIWVWNGAAWSNPTGDNPEQMLAAGSTLYADFGPSGIRRWDGVAWSQLTGGNPENMVLSGSTLYADFGGSGIWVWNGAAWSNPTGANPENMVVSGSTLYADFGGSGIWVWNGAVWSNPTGANPENMVVSGSKLYVDFGGSGISVWNGTAWTQITGNNPKSMAAAN